MGIEEYKEKEKKQYLKTMGIRQDLKKQLTEKEIKSIALREWVKGFEACRKYYDVKKEDGFVSQSEMERIAIRMGIKK